MQARNPYTNRAAIRSEGDFFGRERDLKDIYTRILGGQSVSLVGERRVGKSSLLNALTFPSRREQYGISDEVIFIFMDCQYIVDCEEADFLEYLQSQLLEQTSCEISIAEPRRETLRHVAKALRAEQRRVVLLMDEFDVLVNNARISMEFLSFLRAWSSEFLVPMVIASREGSIDKLAEDPTTGSAFLNIFGTRYLGPLTPEEARELVTTPAELVGEPFTSDEVEWIFELGGCLPLFLQVACYHLLELKRGGTSHEMKGDVLYSV